MSDNKYNFSGANFNSSILNIESNLTGAVQTVGAATNIEQSSKEQLKVLLEQLNNELKRVPPEQAPDAEAVAETAKQLVEQASK